MRTDFRTNRWHSLVTLGLLPLPRCELIQPIDGCNLQQSFRLCLHWINLEFQYKIYVLHKTMKKCCSSSTLGRCSFVLRKQYTLTHWLPCSPWPAVASLGLSSTSDVITFDNNWHHLCSTSSRGEDLSSDAQIRVIGRMEPEICTKMFKKWSEKLRPKLLPLHLTAPR